MVDETEPEGEDEQDQSVQFIHPRTAVPLIVGTDDICFVLRRDGEAMLYVSDGDIELSHGEMVSLYRVALVFLGMVNDVIDQDDEDEDDEGEPGKPAE